MTTNYQTLVDFAWMSQASYLDLQGFSASTPAISLQTRLRESALGSANQFAEQQAVSFTDPTKGYRVQHQQANDGNGFSATVFSSNASGQYSIAVRGTEPFEQFGVDLYSADVGIFFSGKARSQVFAAYRYYKKLIDTGGSVDYTDIEVEQLVQLYFAKYENVPITQLRGRQDFQIDVRDLRLVLANDQGLGVIPAGSAINFAGHSLGGHVAVLLAEMIAHNGINDVSAVYTYNAPGMGGAAAQIGDWLGLVPGAVPNSKITNIVADGGLSMASGLATIWGATQRVFIEHEPGVSIANHLNVPLSDALAVYNLFQKLDPNLKATDIKNILEAESNQPNSSLQNAVEALNGLLRNNTSQIAADDREGLYNALSSLELLIPTTGYKIESLTDLPAKTVASIAATPTESNTDMAYRFALKELNPFAIVGANYSIHNQNGELDLYDATTGEGAITNEYLEDRAAMLSWKIYRNERDIGGLITGQPVSSNAVFIDTKTTETIRIGTVSDAQRRNIYFGGDGADAFASPSGLNDRLYGGGGDDTLNGNGGDDYLQGDAGNYELFQYDDAWEPAWILDCGNDRAKSQYPCDVWRYVSEKCSSTRGM